VAGVTADRAAVIEPGQGQRVRGLEIIGGEVVHRVTGSASAAARDRARRLATSTDSATRTRATASAMDHGDGQADGVRSCGSSG
jgi:hypothetical protein